MSSKRSKVTSQIQPSAFDSEDTTELAARLMGKKGESLELVNQLTFNDAND